MMSSHEYPRIFLQDYQPSNFLIDTAELEFTLDPQETLVKSSLSIRKNPQALQASNDLKLDGVRLELQEIKLDQARLPSDRYELYSEYLVIKNVPAAFRLEIIVKICPRKNFSCTGLYLTNGNFCTQNEPHGFRLLTYFIDRPDILTKFTTTILADCEQYPVLLSNGNQLEYEVLPNRRCRAVWQDPFPKSAYLFALVAGKFSSLEGSHITQSGREITLKIYLDAKYLVQGQHALRALQAAMAWDERRFGLEYDLELYQIVGIDDFNAGAMENKGLNIFNNSLLLASPEVATDEDFKRISAVIAHEYFHNWTGNRVTCRDWFQIGLKEGLTTLREQLFMEETYGYDSSRIEDVRFLYNRQFPEDSSELAHAVRLESYINVNNFYTATVYEKSAEIARMLITLFGKERFYKILTTFLQQFDGHPATIEDFLQVAALVTQQDLTQFKLWYEQCGTPVLRVSDGVEPQLGYYLEVEQLHPKAAKDFYLPLAVGLINAAGTKICDKMLIVSQPRERFYFNYSEGKPILELLRGFSAPVRVEYPYTAEELLRIIQCSDDAFSRWEASQKLLTQAMVNLYQADYEQVTLLEPVLQLVDFVLSHPRQDKQLRAQLIELPSEKQVIEELSAVDIGRLHRTRQAIKCQIAQHFLVNFLEGYQQEVVVLGNYQVDSESIARRALKNRYLDYLSCLDEARISELILVQLKHADNFTDRYAALVALANSSYTDKLAVLDDYYHQWQLQPNLVNKWLALNASIEAPDALARVRALTQHAGFNLKNPNNVYALLRTFAVNNLVNFHAEDGSGYEFLLEQILEVDRFNGQLAANLATNLTGGAKLKESLRQRLQESLAKLLAQPKLSPNLYEIAMSARTE